MTTFVRSVRALAAGTALALASSALVLVAASPAEAKSWTTMWKLHGAKLQMCKKNLGDGKKRVFMRVDNRKGKHRHIAGFSATRPSGKQTWKGVRPKAGRISKTKSIVFRRGDRGGHGISDPGGGAGDGFRLADVRRC